MKGMTCIFLSLVLLTKAQAGEVWEGQSKLTDDQVLDLLVKAIKNEKAERPPLAGIEFRDFIYDEFYSLVRKAVESDSESRSRIPSRRSGS